MNTAAQIVGKAITASTTLLLTVIIGKSLGPVLYGDFTKIFTFVGYFYIFTDFGLNQAYIKIAQKQKAEHLEAYLFGLRLILALALSTAAITISQLLPYDAATGTGFSPQVKLGIIVASITILTQAILTTLNASFQKNLRYDLSTIAAIAGTLTTLAVTISVFLASPGLNMYVAAYVSGAIIVIVVAWLLIRSKLHLKTNPKASPGEFLTLLREAWPVGIALILNMIYFRTDIFILTYTRPPYEVGIYGLAYQFFEASLSQPYLFL